MPKFAKGVSPNPSGRPKGQGNKLPTAIKKSLADLMDGQLERLTDEIKKMEGVSYVEYMMALLPYIVSKKPAENNLTVTAGNPLDTSELKNISLEAKMKIRDILLSEGQTKLIDNV
jgi:hypothetical protein